MTDFGSYADWSTMVCSRLGEPDAVASMQKTRA
jgi:hypothetical protein